MHNSTTNCVWCPPGIYSGATSIIIYVNCICCLLMIQVHFIKYSNNDIDHVAVLYNTVIENYKMYITGLNVLNCR